MAGRGSTRWQLGREEESCPTGSCVLSSWIREGPCFFPVEKPEDAGRLRREFLFQYCGPSPPVGSIDHRCRANKRRWLLPHHSPHVLSDCSCTGCKRLQPAGPAPN